MGAGLPGQRCAAPSWAAWYAAQIPRRWHFCRPQTIELHRTNGSLIGTCHCACGALTDRTGRWIGRNSRSRTPDPAGLRRDPETRIQQVNWTVELSE